MKKILLTAAAAGLLCGCAPADREIKAAVTKNLSQGVPASLVGGGPFDTGSNAVIQEIKVLAIGAAQDGVSGKVYPVKVHLRGTCTITSLAFRGKKNFEGDREFILAKDAYGNWIAASTTLW